jgi:signal peptidase II
VRLLQDRQSTAPLKVAAQQRVLFAGVLATVILLDQATKTWAVRRLAAGDIHVVWTLDLSLTFNEGAAFGIAGGGSSWVIVLAVIAVLGVVLAFGRSFGGPVASVAIALITAGALGNLLDRLFRDTGGAVVDFIDIGWWPTFNVADAAIVVGAIVLVLFATPARRH